MGRTTSFYALREALAQPGCAVCRLTNIVTERYLDNLLWENVNDPGLRRAIRRARGFCREHARKLARPGASLGIAIISRDVLQDVLKSMEDARLRRPSGSLSLRRVRERSKATGATAGMPSLVVRLSPQTECPACIQAAKMEEVYLVTLLDHFLGDDGLMEAYGRGDGLCLPHFRQLLARVRDEALFEALVSVQRVIWERLTDQLSEIIRKSDYRFLDEPWGEEGDAWLRAIAVLAGSDQG